MMVRTSEFYQTDVVHCWVREMARRVESNQSYVGGCAGVDAYVDADADAFLSSCMKQAPIEPVGRGPAIGYSLHAANIQGVNMDL